MTDKNTDATLDEFVAWARQPCDGSVGDSRWFTFEEDTIELFAFKHPACYQGGTDWPVTLSAYSMDFGAPSHIDQVMQSGDIKGAALPLINKAKEDYVIARLKEL